MGFNQGLPLVPFSVEPEPFVSLKLPNVCAVSPLIQETGGEITLIYELGVS